MAKCNHLVWVVNDDPNNRFNAMYYDGNIIKTYMYANRFCPKCGKMIDRPTPHEKANNEINERRKNK